MKICFITNNFPPIVDGVGDYTYHLSNEFIKRGYDVSIVCSAKKEIIEHISKNNWRYVHPVVEKWNSKGYKEAKKKIVLINPDWVILQYVPHAFQKKGIPFLILYFIFLLRTTKSNLGITFHEVSERCSKSIKNIILSILQRIIGHFIGFFTNLSITSINIHTDFLKLIGKKLKIVPIGSNIGYLKSYNSIFSSLTFCYFGSNPRDAKIIPVILKSLIEKGVNAQFLFIGKIEVSFKQELLKLAERHNLPKHNISFTGYVSEQEALSLLNKSHFYLGLFEHGITLKSGSIAAAYAAGVPLIGTYGDMTDLYFFKHKENCILLNEYESLENQIAEIVNIYKLDSEKYRILRSNTHKSYDKYLSWKAITDNYITYLNNMNLYKN